MKLAIFIQSLELGGAQRVAANLADHWAVKGWDITMVTLTPESNDFYELHPAIKRISMDLLSGSSNLLVALKQNLRRVSAFRRVLRELNPDIALSMLSSTNVTLALASRGLSTVCPIGSERTFPPRRPLGFIWETMRRTTYGQLAAVTALTRECASWIEGNTTATRVPVIPNPVRWPLPEQEPRLSPTRICAPGRKLLLGVGRLSDEKNFRLLIDVFSQLAPTHPEWDLAIIGEGPDRQSLESQAASKGLTARIFLPGQIGNVGAWYEHADLYVMSSVFEGFPNALAEALAYGLPAVSFDCDTGPRDIIRHGIDGLLVPPEDVQGFTAALDRIMGDSQMKEMLSCRAIEARERFSIERISAMWEALFDSCALDQARGKNSGSKNSCIAHSSE